METIKYKDFIGSVEVSLKDACLYGKILFINDLVTYQADSIKKIKEEFKAAVDDYIETCKELGIEPHKSFSGTFNVRIGPELHQKVALFATQKNIKINAVVIKSLEKYLDEPVLVQEIHNHTYNFSLKEPFEKLLSDNNEYESKNKVISFASFAEKKEG
jgi:predicted HicB family RNase H-like nuclease